eukprot:gene306-162_t
MLPIPTPLKAAPARKNVGILAPAGGNAGTDGFEYEMDSNGQLRLVRRSAMLEALVCGGEEPPSSAASTVGRSAAATKRPSAATHTKNARRKGVARRNVSQLKARGVLGNGSRGGRDCRPMRGEDATDDDESGGSGAFGSSCSADSDEGDARVAGSSAEAGKAAPSEATARGAGSAVCLALVCVVMLFGVLEAATTRTNALGQRVCGSGLLLACCCGGETQGNDLVLGGREASGGGNTPGAVPAVNASAGSAAGGATGGAAAASAVAGVSDVVSHDATAAPVETWVSNTIFVVAVSGASLASWVGGSFYGDCFGFGECCGVQDVAARLREEREAIERLRQQTVAGGTEAAEAVKKDAADHADKVKKAAHEEAEKMKKAAEQLQADAKAAADKETAQAKQEVADLQTQIAALKTEKQAAEEAKQTADKERHKALDAKNVAEGLKKTAEIEKQKAEKAATDAVKKKRKAEDDFKDTESRIDRMQEEYLDVLTRWYAKDFEEDADSGCFETKSAALQHMNAAFDKHWPKAWERQVTLEWQAQRFGTVDYFNKLAAEHCSGYTLKVKKTKSWGYWVLVEDI